MLFTGFDTAHALWSQVAAPITDATRAKPRSGSGPRYEEVGFARNYFRTVIELPDEESLHVIVDNRNGRRQRSGIICHVWHGPERDTYVRLADSLCVSSPEACWCQMATRLDLVDLVRFGYELCGTYRPSCPMGFDWTKRGPLTSHEKLANYLRRLPEGAGSARAREALRFFSDGSASPRETTVSLLLCLPRRCGGYGFKLPVLNARLALGQGGARLTQRRYFVADMLWSDERVCVEYDSDLFHANENRSVMDSSKRNALLALGYRVVTLTNNQVKDARHFDEFAGALAKLLGPRLRVRSQGWLHRKAFLRRRLLLPKS